MKSPPDEEAFGASRAKLVALARRVHAGQDAEDVVQEVLSRLLERGARDLRSVEAWLTTSVRNAAIDARRRAVVHRRAVYLLAGEQVAAELPCSDLDDEIDRLVRALVATFGARTCAALLMREAFDLSYEDLARDSGRTAIAWRQMLHRAARRLRERGFARRRLDEEELRAAALCRAALATADVSRLRALVGAATTARGTTTSRRRAAAVITAAPGTAAVPARAVTALAFVNGRYVLALVLDGHVLCAVPVGATDATEARVTEPERE